MTWTAQSLTQLATGYWPAATLIAAVRLRLFETLDGGPASADAVAASLSLPADRLVHLLDALAAMRLLTKSPAGDYAIDADARPLLSRTSPTCLLDALAYNADLYRQWTNLADTVCGTATPPAGGKQLGDDPAMTRRFVLGMEAKARAFSPAIAQQIDLGDARTLLDVGSGPGTLTRLLLERYSALHATLLDLSPVLAVARDVCRASPVFDRLSFHPADYRQDPLPGPFDAVVYAGALHQETPASAADLFAKLRHATRPGGRVFIVDLMLDDDRTAPAFSALFQLNMMLLRPGARVFSVSEVIAVMRDAGFVDVSAEPVDATPYRIVRAETR
ncbi:MAG TPA: methyltransferase [Tepidisphaeraceae bacterium]|jgi:SAM-dependent methyltransferase